MPLGRFRMTEEVVERGEDNEPGWVLNAPGPVFSFIPPWRISWGGD